MNNKIMIAVSACALAFGSFAEDGFVSLFDGKTLDGWKILGGEAKFSVENGCIKGEGVPSDLGINTFLTTEKTYGDFDLKVEFNCESGNSGVQFRSETREKYDPAWDWSPFKEGLHKVFGYQAEITPDGASTGRIYDEERRGYRDGVVWLDTHTPQSRLQEAERSFRKGDWNTMEVRCEGPHIRTWLNGHLVADFRDEMTPRGLIGLQVHQQGPKKEGVAFKPMVVRFRNARIKELPAPAAPRAGTPRFDIGIARYTMWNTPFTNALEIAEKVGCRYMSLLEGSLATNADAKAIHAYKDRVAKYGITVDTLGPSAFKDEQSAENWFAFAKRYGMKMITVLPFEMKAMDGKEKMVESEAMLDVLEKMVKKYDIKAAIHNHGPESPYLYPTGESVWKRIATRDRRIGFCFDIGHQARFGGGDPAKFIREHGDRIYDVHLKNIKVDPVLNLAEPGPRGELDIYGVMKALAEVGFDGVCHIEYEKDHGNNLAPLAESIGYYRGILEALKRSSDSARLNN